MDYDGDAISDSEWFHSEMEDRESDEKADEYDRDYDYWRENE